jgi:hypothetical protein
MVTRPLLLPNLLDHGQFSFTTDAAECARMMLVLCPYGALKVHPLTTFNVQRKKKKATNAYFMD